MQLKKKKNKLPRLFIICGPSGSGKTYLAHQFINEYSDEHILYVSRDEIRFSLLKEDEDYFLHEKEVFKKFSYLLADTLMQGLDVFADATHVSIQSRKKLLNAIDKYITDYEINYIVLNTTLEKCLSNNENRIGRQKVPNDVIISMYNSFVKPTFNEDSRIKSIIYI